jgi:transposase
MSGFIEGEDRNQATLFPERIDDYVAEDSPVRVVDVFIDDLDISGLGFRTEPNATGRPSYHPKMMLKLYVYGYLNRVQSSRRLEREAQRNVELMWLTGRLAPDFKTIADFRKNNGEAIRLVCRKLGLLNNTLVAIDGSKFKAVNNRDKNFTRAKMKRRLAEVEASVDRYLMQLTEVDAKETDDEYECPAGKRLTHRTTTTEKGKEIKRYWTSACSGCAIKTQCTTGNERRVSRWVHADVLDRAQARLDKRPDSMRVRRATVEHPFGTIKSWMGATHFQMKTLPRVSTEMSLHVLSYNMKRAINLMGTKEIIAAIRA